MKRILPIFLTLVLLTFNTGIVHTEDIGGRTFVLRDYEYLKDGTIKLGALIVETDQDSKEAKIHVTQFDSKGNGVNRYSNPSNVKSNALSIQSIINQSIAALRLIFLYYNNL